MEKKIERFTQLHRSLKAARFGKTVDELADEVGVSRATIYRDLDFLKSVLGAPIDMVDGKHRYARDEAAAFELPGFWFSAEEMYALVLTRQIVGGQLAGTAVSPSDDDVDYSMLGSSLDAAQARIGELLGEQAKQLQRLKVLRHNSRRINERIFRVTSAALLERKVLRIEYRPRSTEDLSWRAVHPQRLIHYRDNWYLDAFDETRNALRSFSLDRISSAMMLEQRCQDLADEDLDRGLNSGYGIFKGESTQKAVIRFSAHAARWAAEESWHQEQVVKFLTDGSFELTVPYSNGRELLMDVLRYGPDAEIIGPVSLREQMRSWLTLTAENYAL